jgi:hypothetical protein
VASELKALSYLRTGYVWSDDQAHFPEAAWFGGMLPTTPGKSNWAFKTLPGILPTDQSVLTDTKIAFLEGKNGNYYMTVGGVNITQSGVMSGGEWIDVVVGRDWLKAGLQQDIFFLQVTVPKIGFDDAGIGLLVNAIKARLQQGVDNGIIEEGSINVTTPLASSFSSSQKNTRILPSIPWTATLKGAINNLTVTGNLVP